MAALRPLLNLASKEDFLLTIGWLVGCFYPLGPRAILQLLGEQGSAKSSQARLLRSLVDPNTLPLRAQPRDEGDLLIAARNGAVVALDNLSHMPQWLSDALCRLATGGGLSKRELYTDADEVLLDAKRPVILTAIAEVATASDLLDRALTVTLPSIPPDERRTEVELAEQVERVRPIVLGGLLDAVAGGLAGSSGTRPSRRPRLADFASFVEAAAPILGWEPEAFLDAMESTRRDADATAIEALPIGPALLQFMAKHTEWEGTATELLASLNAHVADETRRTREWPKHPNRLAAQLRRLAPNLRQVGLWVANDRRSGGQRVVTLTKNRELWVRHHRHDRRDTRSESNGDDEEPGRSSSPDRHVAPSSRNQHDDRDDDDDGFPVDMRSHQEIFEEGQRDDIEEFFL